MSHTNRRVEMIEAIKAAIQAFIITLVMIIIVIGFNEVQADQFITMPAE